ncbi:hypothetical protein KAJ27_03990 [bacterium]|nr:hypothetical protein [bacterium]
MFKNLMILTLLVMVLCPVLSAEPAQFIRIPCEIEIVKLDAGIVQDAPGGAPKWMYTDWRLREIAFKIRKVAPQSQWVLYRYGDENPTATKVTLNALSKKLNDGRKTPLSVDVADKINYIDEVYNLLKKHRRKFSSNVKGPLLAHIIYTWGINNDGSLKGGTFRPRYISGPRGTAGQPMTFPENTQEAYTGVTEKCGLCNGTGKNALGKTCPGCHGAGLTGPMMHMEEKTKKYTGVSEKCGLCNGTGKMGLKTCPGCHGAGWSGPMMYKEK